jgi:hypothetical protein
MKNNSIPKEFLALESICPYSYQIKLSDYLNCPDNQLQLTRYITHIIEVAFQTLNNNKGSEIYLYLYPKAEKKPIKLVSEFDKMFADSIDEINNEPRYMKFTKSNLALVSKTIKKHLSPDLLPKKYRKQNEISSSFGHCHTANGLLWSYFKQDLDLYQVEDLYLTNKYGRGSFWHWYCKRKDNGVVIDLTSEQYDDYGQSYLDDLYSQGIKKNAILGFDYKKRLLKLQELVQAELDD